MNTSAHPNTACSARDITLALEIPKGANKPTHFTSHAASLTASTIAEVRSSAGSIGPSLYGPLRDAEPDPLAATSLPHGWYLTDLAIKLPVGWTLVRGNQTHPVSIHFVRYLRTQSRARSSRPDSAPQQEQMMYEAPSGPVQRSSPSSRPQTLQMLSTTTTSLPLSQSPFRRVGCVPEWP